MASIDNGTSGSEPFGFTDTQRIRLFEEADGHGASWHIASFADFDLSELKHAGIEHVLLDLDGCLTPAYYHDQLTEEVRRAVKEMKAGLATVSLATNNEVDLSVLHQSLNLDHLFQPYQEGTMLPYKPNPAYYRHVLSVLGVAPETIVMIGDNPHDDVWGASQHGIQTMLVDRLDPYGFF